MKIEFCLPIYNEEKILEPSARRLADFCLEKNYQFAWQIVLLVNGSTDGSYALAEKMAAQEPGLFKAVNFAPAGRGFALKRYYEESRADILVYMDIDLAVSLDNLSALLDPIVGNQADLVIGSRLLPDSKIERSFIRELSSQSYNFLSRMILSHKFSDLQCGFKAVRADVFRKISPYIRDGRWFFDTELIAFCRHFNYRVKEIPVDWSENRWDERKSKVNLLKDSCKFIYNLIKLKIRLLSSHNS